MRVAAIQTTASADRDRNLSDAAVLVDEAAGAGASLVVLPEYFSVAGDGATLRAMAEPLDGPTVGWAAALAARHRIWLVAGTFPEAPTSVARQGDGAGSDQDDRVHNTSCVLAPDGTLVAVYRKIHLFDVTVPGAAHRESADVAPGTDVTVTPWGSAPDDPILGLATCYDLRFPELFGTLARAGATVVAVPAAFTAETGAAHWELLVRARALENQIFLVAADQVGTVPSGIPPCHGHSMIVDPWGTVLGERHDPSPGVVVADLDRAHQARIRRELPVLVNRRPGTYR